MSKIFMVPDTHLGLGYPNSSNKWVKIHVEYFYKFLIPLLEAEVKEGDIIIHLGDFFDNRNFIGIDTLNLGFNILEKLCKIAPCHIITGNHDQWNKSSSDINSIKPFRYIPNIFIYNKTTRIEYNKLKLCLMPYIENKQEQINLIEENKDCDYLFCHSDLNGAKLHLYSAAHKNLDKIDVETFSNFKKVFSGHIHLFQKNKNFTFVGNIFEMDRNDMGNQKGIFILDTDDGSEHFIPNTTSPIFKKISILREEDIDMLDHVNTSRDYVDLLISNSLLIDNRKLRRKLEKILETNNFASVEYIDDIKTPNDEFDVESKVEIDETDMESILIDNNFNNMLINYIKQSYLEDDKIKEGLLSELSSIIDIYEQNYKFDN